MAAEAFINIRIIAAFMLEGRISELYQQLLSGPSKDSFRQALVSGAGYAIGQGVIFLVSIDTLLGTLLKQPRHLFELAGQSARLVVLSNNIPI